VSTKPAPLTLEDIINECYATAKLKGWHNESEYSPRTFGDIIALCHSELSEALEQFRDGHIVTEIYFDEGEKPEGVPIELADVLIRIFDYCGRRGVPIEDALKIKMAYNKERPMRHGGKAI
jgi:NTP pyrophosphatase (non-canonical NTP hydrolase)